MKNTSINWSLIDWTKFQQLCVYLAQEEYRNLRLEEFLKQGHKQDGIDLISTTQSPFYLAIQCKEKEKLGIYDLNAIQKEFEEGQFAGKVSTFILATTADLQLPKIKTHLLKQTEAFKKKGVAFIVWDKAYLESQLRNFYSIVAYYFGNRTAEEHCFEREASEKFESLGTAYIPRRVFPIELQNKDPHWKWFIKGQNTKTIIELLTHEPLNPKRICIVGDPYQGKTYMLKQAAYELTQLEMRFTPIWITIKSFAVQPIGQLLQTKIGAWQNTPTSEIVIFLDGLDEVATDHFTEAVQHINAFVTQYPSITIVFSCRKLFYNHYRLSIVLPDFTTYELYDLTEKEVTEYLKVTLSKRYKKFIEEVDRVGLRTMLYDPFYLSQFVSSFKNSPHKIPNSRLEAIDGFINKSIHQSELRKLSAGKDFHEKVHSYRICIQKFAFVFQAMGLNSLPDATMQKVFTDGEIELIKHSSFVTEMNGQWSFTSALFQEYLTARVLLAMNSEEVIPLVTVGKDIRKIKQKWLQTFSTLLGFTETGSEKERIYLDVLETDSIELIFLQTERSKYTAEFRLEALKKLVKRCSEKNIRPMVIYEDTIGKFIGRDAKCIDFLVSCLNDKEHKIVTKITCCRILATCFPDNEFPTPFKHVLLNQFRSTEDVEYAVYCLGLLDHFGLHDIAFLEEVTQQANFSAHHSYRLCVYKLIDHANQVDYFYSYGLDGLSHLIEHNRGVSHVGSETEWLKFLTAARNPTNLKALYKLISTSEWSRFMEDHSSKTKDFLERLSDQTVEVFKTYPAIIFTLVEYIRTLNSRSMDEELPGLFSFFEQTGTHYMVVSMLCKEILGSDGSLYGCLLSEDTIDYLMFEFEEGNYPTTALTGALLSLQRKPGKGAAYEKFNAIWNDLRALDPVSPDSERWQEQAAFEEAKRQNDIVYMQSREAFIKGVEQMFKAHGKEAIEEDDLYVEFDDRSEVRRAAASTLLYSFLIKFISDNKVSSKKVYKWLENSEAYDYFIATELLNRNFANTEEEAVVRRILQDYFNRGIKVADFENTYKYKEGNRFTYKKKEVLLGEIFNKYSFTTPPSILKKFVWLDNEGNRDLFQNSENQKTTLVEKAYGALPQEEQFSFREEVIENMHAGILHEAIFDTHVALCVHFNLEEAIPFLLKKIGLISGGKDKWDMISYINSYIKLGGCKEELKPFLVAEPNEFNHHFFNLADHLKTAFPDFVKLRLSELMELPAVTNGNKTEAALKLADLGDEKGFGYVIDLMLNTGFSPTDSPNNYSMAKQNTDFALSKLTKVRHLVLKEQNRDGERYWNEARRTIVEIIAQLANKSEDDLKKVIAFYEQAYKDFIKHPRVSDFTWYAERCKENFKETGEYLSDVNLVVSLFKKALPNLPD